MLILTRTETDRRKWTERKEQAVWNRGNGGGAGTGGHLATGITEAPAYPRKKTQRNPALTRNTVRRRTHRREWTRFQRKL